MLQQSPKKCPTFSSVFLVGVNVIYFIFGLLLIGLSSWGITQQKSDPVTDALPAGSLNTLVAVGVFLIILSVLGWLGVRFNYKVSGRYMLGFYGFFTVLIMLMEFSAAIALFTFVGTLDDFSPALQFKDYGIFYLVNQSYVDCCCSLRRCPNETCWLPANLPYPCDSVDTFKVFLMDFISERIRPVAGVALFLCLLQLFTSITACCNQCAGKTLEEQKKMSGPLSYDGLYAENDEGAGYGYESYVKSGQARPGSAAAAAAAPGGATAPRAPPGGAPPARPGGRPPAKK